MIANFPSLPIRPGSMGRPMPGITARIIDQVTGTEAATGTSGMLALKSGWPSMFRGYLHDERRYRTCFAGDWYLTGDMASMDQDGYFWFTGRSDDMIKSAGHLIGPFEVERVLAAHPAVAEGAAFGLPDPMLGELVKACVVLRPGFLPDENLQQDILGFARRHLGPAVAPRQLSFVPELPKNRAGKIMRRLLKARELGQPEGDLSTLEVEAALPAATG
jgi:acetyl-CoA synthetase